MVLAATGGVTNDRLARVDNAGVLRWQDTNEELALFGVNYYLPFWHNYPDLKAVGADHREVIDQDVTHFARLGLDALRLHVFDREVSDGEGNLLPNEHLALLDCLIARARDRGIYTVLTPIAWWPVPGDSPGFSTRFTMPQMTTDRAAWRPQTNYLVQFLNHTNRYSGRAYKDDPAVVAFELINEPQYPSGITDAQITKYINTLADALRSTGCRKPVFYNGWLGHLGAVAAARVDGSTFGWYPSGLVAGRSLRKNFLPQVQEYGGTHPWNPSLRDPVLATKAKIVYEFDAADIPGSYIYPAMARSFRTGGAQIATQFQYDPLPLAPFNQGWQTHYLNLVCAPQKSVSFLIAAEAFRRVPRHQDYGRHPASNRFGPFRVSYEEDLSEMITEREFLHSNTTRSAPPAPDQLERIVGCGSSPVVTYAGTGAYFLERLARGVWRLEVYPDAVWVNDPYGPHRLDREVARILWHEWPLEIRLNDLGPEFTVEPLNDGNTHRATAIQRRFPVRPGVYALRRPDLARQRLPDENPAMRVGLREFVALPANLAPPVVRHEARTEWVEGKPMALDFTLAAATGPDEVTLKFRSNGTAETRQVALKAARSYEYAAIIPAECLTTGMLTYSLTVRLPHETLIFPTNTPVWTTHVVATNAPVALFDAERHRVQPQGDTPNQTSLKPGMTPGRRALRIAVNRFGPPPSSTSFRTELSEDLDPWRELLAARTTLRLAVRALEPTTTAMEVVLLERDGTPWGTNVPLTTQWQNVRVPLASLRHWAHWGGSPAGRGGPRDRVHPEELTGVNVCFGAWLYPNHAAEVHTIDVEAIAVE